VPAGDVDAIVERLERLYRDPALAEEMGRQANLLARRDMSWARYGDGMAATYEKLLRARGFTGSPGSSLVSAMPEPRTGVRST